MKRAILIAALAALAIPAWPAQAQVSVTCFAPTTTQCAGKWHRSDVRVDWSVTAPYAPVSGCTDEVVTDTIGTWRECLAQWIENGVKQGEDALKVNVKVDTRPPDVTVFARAPDYAGWYRSPVQVTFSGDDVTSGVDGCSSGTYSGPDAAAAQVLGRCWDIAGNVSAPLAFGLRYDANPPSLGPVAVSGRDHKARLEWNLPDAASVDVWRVGTRKKLLSGGPSGSLVDRRLRNGRRYQYLVSATDAAGNTAKRTLSVVPGPRLFGPAHGARLDGPPLLRWTGVRNADYYNVQLFRGRRKILSAWPEKPRLQLRNTWRYGGKTRRLKPGKRYRWYVWPGKGARSRNAYGRLIGARTFVITP